MNLFALEAIFAKWKMRIALVKSSNQNKTKHDILHIMTLLAKCGKLLIKRLDAR